LIQKPTAKKSLGVVENLASTFMSLFSESSKEIPATKFKVSISPPVNPIEFAPKTNDTTPIKSDESALRRAEVVASSTNGSNPIKSQLGMPANLASNLFESYVENFATNSHQVNDSVSFDPSQSFHPSAFWQKASTPFSPDTGSSGRDAKISERKSNQQPDIGKVTQPIEFARILLKEAADNYSVRKDPQETLFQANPTYAKPALDQAPLNLTAFTTSPTISSTTAAVSTKANTAATLDHPDDEEM
jgi:hypothetical protein